MDAASSGGDDRGVAVTTTVVSASAADEDTGGGGAASGSLTATESLPDIGTSVVRTADLRIAVDNGDFAARFRDASALARSLGGFVASSSTSSYEEGSASGDVTLRVPVERFDEAITRLGKLGSVESSSEEGQDVTDQLVDLGARLRSLRAEEQALDALMAEAANVNEVLSIRSSSVGIREQIEQLAAQQASLQDRSAYSTIHAVLHEASAVVASTSPHDWGLGDAAATAVDAAEAIVGSLIVGVGVAVPLLPFALVILFVARRRRAAAATGG
jgi:hypothetical protein